MLPEQFEPILGGIGLLVIRYELVHLLVNEHSQAAVVSPQSLQQFLVQGYFRGVFRVLVHDDFVDRRARQRQALFPPGRCIFQAVG